MITSTWLEDPDDRPTFSQIVKNLSSICNFTEVADEEESIKDNEDTAENSGYIKIVPTWYSYIAIVYIMHHLVIFKAL